MKGGDAVKQNRFWRVAIPVGIALWTAFIWSRSLMNAADSTADSNAVAAWLMGLLGWETRPVWLTYVIRKAAHFAEFLVLGTLWGVGGRLYALPLTWLYGVAVGAADECLQFLAPGRAPMVTDVMIDTAGYLCGWLLVLLVAHLRKRRGMQP